MKLLLFVSIAVFLFSCTSPDQTAQIESLKVLQSCTLNQFAHGSEKMLTIEYYTLNTEAQGEDGRASSFQILLNSMNRVDSVSIPLMQKINSLRLEVVDAKKQKVKFSPNRPIEIDYSIDSKLNQSAALTKEEIKEIITSIEEYRNELCRIIVQEIHFELFGKQRKFVAPSIPEFKDEQEKMELIDAQLKRSDVNQEDIDILKDIMDILTKKEETWKSMLTNNENWIDLSMSLLSVEEFILRARTIALGSLQLRVGFCGESIFSSVSPIVVGSSNALPNDTIQFQVFLGAQNEYSKNEIEIFHGGKFLKREKGRSFIETVVPASGEIEIEGQILYQLKNGKIKPIPWSHKVKVIDVK